MLEGVFCLSFDSLLPAVMTRQNFLPMSMKSASGFDKSKIGMFLSKDVCATHVRHSTIKSVIIDTLQDVCDGAP